MTHRPQQLALDLLQPPQPSFASYVVGRNAEAVAALRALLASAGELFVYLWGDSGSGRSHLLQAVATSAPSRYSESPAAPAKFDPSIRLFLIDDVDRLPDDGQQRLFRQLNEVRAAPPAAIVTSGSAAPAQLALRDDVRTRLGWGLVYQLHGLTDAEKSEALRARASALGFELPQTALL